jgi:hypothetical protein
MGGSVSSFVSNVGKQIAKGATSALGNMVPIIGKPIADGLNSLYARGGKVMPRFEEGGVVPPGFKAKPINTPAELIRIIKAFPEEAKKANLSVQDVKDAVAELKGQAPQPAMARGGMAMARGGQALMPGQRAMRGRGGSIN